MAEQAWRLDYWGEVKSSGLKEFTPMPSVLSFHRMTAAHKRSIIALSE